MKTIVIFLYFFFALASNGAILHFKKYNFHGVKKGNTLLVIGGIHGNEPGGYFAPSVLIQHYKITKGNLIVIPNLNFDSDIRNQRGVYKDMNRKFAYISKKDPDYKIIKDIKKIILSKNIDLILNLHDGHGFYRRKWENKMFNPKAWGQALIIDQINIKTKKYHDLGAICNKIANKINNEIFKKMHIFRVKNTKTKYHDAQMRLSLTYFAITHDKPALAIETSKNITYLPKKVYYQLLAIEGFMKMMGIKYKRDFKLNEKSISLLLKQYGELNINKRFKINLNKVKSFVNFVPIKKNYNKFIFSHPLGATLRYKNYYTVMIGNKKILSIKGEYFKLSRLHPKIILIADGKKIDATKLLNVDVKNSFKVRVPKKIRVNVIGFSSKKHKNEANIKILKKSIKKRFSLYKKEDVFRIEFYDNKNRYIKTILVHFQ